MPKYVDGFVLPVAKKNLAAYHKMAREAGKTWKRYGALDYFECVGDDLKPKMPGAKLRTFPVLAKAKPGETVIFAFIIYRSRQHRDQVNKRITAEFMSDPKNKEVAMPFDVRRMAYGGFTAIVEA